MEFFLSSFGLHNPYIVTKLPEHAIFPISNDCKNGLDLDYTSLLLGKRYYIDKDAFEYICYSEKEFLKPMSSTLSFLKEEGLVEIIDVAKLVSTHLEDLKSKVETLSRNTQMWLPVIKQQWMKVKNEYKEFQTTFACIQLKYCFSICVPQYTGAPRRVIRCFARVEARNQIFNP